MFYLHSNVRFGYREQNWELRLYSQPVDLHTKNMGAYGMKSEHGVTR